MDWDSEFVGEQEFKDWLPPSEALRQITLAFMSEIEAKIAISERLCADMIVAVAERTVVEGRGDDGKPRTRLRVPTFVWKHLDAKHFRGTKSFWITNQQIVYIPDSFGSGITIKLFGIRFEPSGVQGLIPPKVQITAASHVALPPQPELDSPPTKPGKLTGHAVPDTPAPAPPKHAGGRPRKEFWDDLWIAMFRRLWAENWQPKSQTEVENAMLDWATAHDHDLGPTSVKSPARKLYLLMKE